MTGARMDLKVVFSLANLLFMSQETTFRIHVKYMWPSGDGH